MNQVIATMSAVFAPFVYILAAAGLLQGCLIVITQLAPGFAATGVYEVFNFISWTPFTFLPAFIALSASKHFKCNVYVALACCLALVSPSWGEMAARITDGEQIKFVFLNLASTTYTSTVLPPLFLVLVLSYLERFLEKKLPDAIKALVIGGVWQVIVVFGVHWGMMPIILADFAANGFDSIQVFITCAVLAQVGATFAVFVKSRNKEFKPVALSAGLTGIFGITEPAIYGVTLRLKKPLICGCISAAVRI